MKGKNVQRLVGEPMPIDMKPEEKRRNGLLVGPVHMKNIAMKDNDGDSVFNLTVNIEKQ